MRFNAPQFSVGRFRFAYWSGTPQTTPDHDPRFAGAPLSRNRDMPERQYRTLSKRIVDRLAVNGKDAVF